ncbi:hypothetical protein BJ912DRAFT_648792 [Pholiota molesta]|nr:hypothetical protein BJ912DRAFT_648792 [Pholiota molesta]
MGRRHTTATSHRINCNNVNSIITSNGVIRVDATPSTTFMDPQSSGSHTVTYSNNINCDNVNSTITGDTYTVINSNIGNKNSGNVDINDWLNGRFATTTTNSFVPLGAFSSIASVDTNISSGNVNSIINEGYISTANPIFSPGGISSTASVDTTFLSSDSNNSRTFTSKGSGNRLKRFGKLVKKAFKVVTTTIGGILAPSRMSKIQAEENARRDEVFPPSYTEVIENTEKAKAQPSSPTPATSNSEMNAPQVAGKSSPVSDTVLPSTIATDFDQADADHTKKEESASASGARRTRLTKTVSL